MVFEAGIVWWVAAVVGFLVGFHLGKREGHRTAALKIHNRFGPCPSCHVPCNLEEWRCGSCGSQLHGF